MTLGRSEAEWLAMTPRKLHALADVHADVINASSESEPTRKASANPAADLAALGADL